MPDAGKNLHYKLSFANLDLIEFVSYLKNQEYELQIGGEFSHTFPLNLNFLLFQ